MSSRSFDLTMRVAHAYIARGNIDSAARLIESAVLVEPMNADVYRAWGHILVARNQVEDAVFAFETAASFGPANPEHHFELAGALANLADQTHSKTEQFHILAEAWKAANEGLRIAPEDLTGRSLIDRIELEQDALCPPELRSVDKPSRRRVAALLLVQLGPAAAYVLLLNGIGEVPSLSADQLLVATALILLMTVVVRLVYLPTAAAEAAPAPATA